MTAPATARPKLPDLPRGLRMSEWWIGPNGTPIHGDVEVPVDKDLRIAAHLMVCPMVQLDDCGEARWHPAGTPAETVYCPRHGQPLIAADTDPGATNPVATGRARIAELTAKVLADRKASAAASARRIATAAQVAATDAARQRHADLRRHLPTIGASAAIVVGGQIIAGTNPVSAALAGMVGAAVTPVVFVAGNAAAYRRSARRMAETAEAGPVGVSPKRWQRWFARTATSTRAAEYTITTTISAAVAGSSGWLLLAAAATPMNPAVRTMVLTPMGAAMAWAVCRRYWEMLWDRRRDAITRARLAAEAAARRAAEEAERLARLATETSDTEAATVGDDDPVEVGRRFAAQWRKVADQLAQPGMAQFPMGRCWVVPEDTQVVTIPTEDGGTQQVGYEFAIASEPGVMVGRAGTGAPIVTAREWLAAVLFPDRDPATVATVDRPDGRVNRASILITDGVALGGAVPWKGPAGVRISDSGVITVHEGRTLRGEDVYGIAYTPGQAGGGLDVGHTGGGKTAGTVLRILNYLAAGIFVALHDPKHMDYMDFAGVIPIGVTTEHRDVILRSYIAERIRREQYLGSRRFVNRHGHQQPGLPVWDVNRDGPPLAHIWEEFHIHATDAPFVEALTLHVRLQRSTAGIGTGITQGGGLADLKNSVLRGLWAQTGLRVYRMPDSQAHLAGYSGQIPPSTLPRMPGVCLSVAEGSPAVPMRMAYIPREDIPGCVWDCLYAPDGTPILTAPALPAATLEVFEREGLMDLWRLGMGPNGAVNLLSESPSAPTMSTISAPPDGGKKAPVADVVLGAAYAIPGRTCSAIHAEADLWLKAGWNEPPNLSSVTRAAKKLDEENGMVARDEAGQVTVTAKGTLLARSAAIRLGLIQVAPSEADIEHAKELEEENDE